jgi:hypothetical protein
VTDARADQDPTTIDEGPEVAHPDSLPRVVAHRSVDTECEVLVDVADDVWRFGVIAEWRRHEDGQWTAWVRYDSPTGNRVGIIRPDRLREPEIDWARGRAASSDQADASTHQIWG